LSNQLQGANRKVPAQLTICRVLKKYNGSNESNGQNNQGVKDQLIREVEGYALLYLHCS
jgi:hypothetical protein